jgi:hypothetical protein
MKSRAALAALALLFIPAPLAAQQVSGESAQHNQDAREDKNDPAPLPSESGEQSAKSNDRSQNEHEAESGPLGLNAEWWIAIFTAVLTGATAGLWRATNQLGVRADEGLRKLERPYVGVHILSNNLKAAIEQHAPLTPWPHVDFIIVNRGKTPAFLVSGMAWLEAETRDVVGMVRDSGNDDLLLEGVVLGADDRTRPNFRAAITSEFGMAGSFNVTRGEWTLKFRGHVAYRDIWGNGYVEEWSASYNVLRERFVWWRQERPLKEDTE